ncbi:hypothetical protein F511_20748 [Dorcoceras hygrometricum]|uniref:Uncharacterized protein n=1 Tax=Dorcoceras hygrometricum TaxID=472368 RepID=A0A2Z7D9Z5_9LAMI|nr:hypothetical protein F511_20748 [Dorcoceras hygrometricum]
MPTPSDSAVSSTAASIDSVPVGPETKEPRLPDQAKLGSSSQPWSARASLAPNSYSFLLVLAVLLSYFNIPLIPYVLMQLIQIKRLVPGKFYLSHKGDHTFIGGNPSSHNGWMSRFFYVGRFGRKRNPCCRVDALAPTREESPAPTPPSPTTPMPPKTIPKVRSSGVRPRMDTGLGRAPALNIFEDSFVVSPFGSVATGLLCNMIPNRDVSRVRNATNSEAVGLFAAQFAAAMVWGGEVISRLTQAQREVNDTCQSFDDHTELEMQLADLEAARAQENRAAEAKKEALEAQVKGLAADKVALVAEKEDLAAEKKAIEVKLETLAAKKTAVEVELDETKARAEVEIGRLRSEAVNAWGLGKEEFLKSSEFDDMCTKRSLAYFESDFKSCVAQFRANGYSEEEHSDPFLSVARALDELPDDEEEADDGADEDASGDETTPLNSLEH